MKLVAHMFWALLEGEIKSHEWMKQRGRFWLGTERTSSCLPCLALVGRHCVAASLYVKGYYSCFSYKETTTQRVSAPALVLLRRGQGRFKSRPVWSSPYVFLPPGPVNLSCPLVPWVILCPSDPPSPEALGQTV